MGIFDDSPLFNRQGSFLSRSSGLIKSKSKSTSPDLNSVEGLTAILAALGKQKDAKRLSEERNPEKRFSGGFLQDIFDVIGVPQSQIVGMIKGISAKEAYQERQSFRDVLPDTTGGKIAGTVGDILLDPLNLLGIGLIGKAGKAEELLKATNTVMKGKKITPGETVVGAIKKATSGVGETKYLKPIKDFLGDKFSYLYGADPVFKEAARDFNISKGFQTQRVLELVRPLTKLGITDQRLIAAARKSGDVMSLPKKLQDVAQPAFRELDDLGRQAVDVGLLDEETYLENIGKYIPRLYRKHEIPDDVAKQFLPSKNLKVETARFKARKDIPDEVREAMGEITEAGYPTAKGLVQLSQSVETAKFFNWVNANYATDLAREGFERLPGGSRLLTMTGDRVSLLREVGELSPVRKKIGSMIGRKLSTVTKLSSEVNRLEKAGLSTALRESGDTKMADLISGLVYKASPFEGGLKETTAKVLPATMKLRGETSVKNFVERLITAPDADIAKLKKLVATRENKLGSILDEIRDMRGEFETIATKAKDLRTDLAGIKGAELAGKYVPKPIASFINEAIRPPATGLEKIVSKSVGAFKFGKVILNPATHARNIMSNLFLNDFEGLSPARLDIYGRALKQITTKGDMYKEARRAGLGLDTFASAELKDILEASELAGTKVGRATREALKRTAALYQKEEELAKMAQYIFQRGKGLDPKEAYRVAERATFNYAEVTPFIRKVRQSAFGMPFITFTAKATPQVAKTLVSDPAKISKLDKIMRGVESLTPEDQLNADKKAQPEWMKNGLYLRLPGADKYGRGRFFDLSFILPFGDIISGNLFEGRTDRETGLPENLLTTVGRNSPLIDIISSLAKNQDFSGNPIYKPSDADGNQGKDILQYITKQVSPSLATNLLQLPRSVEFEKTVAEQGGLPEFGGETRSITQELMRTLVGLKETPFRTSKQSAQREREQIKRLQKALRDAGLTYDFFRPVLTDETKEDLGF